MTITRGLSQVLFSFLPDQTADLEGGVWQVTNWSDARFVPVDDDVVRREVARAAYPWTAAKADSGLADHLLARREMQVVTPSDSGIEVSRFPELFRCKNCGRLSNSNDGNCQCGSHARAQLAFVAFHRCGRAETPWIPTCATHKQVRLRALPGTIRTGDLIFDCPVCGQEIRRGFPFLKCDCNWGGTLEYNVHRAAVVYTPRTTVIVNPPDPAVAAQLRAPAAADLTLRWALGGMREKGPLDSAPSIDGFVAMFEAQGFDSQTAQAMAEAAAAQAGAQISTGAADLELADDAKEEAFEAALKLAYAVSGGRVRLDELVARSGPGARARYEQLYPPAIHDAGLAEVELLETFPVLTTVFGYTRGEAAAGRSTLRPFRASDGSVRMHAIKAETEGLLFRLDPLRVASWLAARGHLGVVPSDPFAARLAIIRSSEIPSAGEDPALATPGADLLRLIHSLSHRVIRKISAFAGIEREALSEYLVPLHLAFVVFAASRGDFVLGGLQALFENDLDKALREVVHGEPRCALDPGCTRNGSACAVCLHVGEPSCRYYNQFLARTTLFGAGGYLTP
jgi:hypothetical protein